MSYDALCFNLNMFKMVILGVMRVLIAGIY